MWTWLWVGLAAVAWAQRPPSTLSKRHDVYIAGFFPYSRHVPESVIGRGVMPAVKLAVDHINDSPTVLRNYRLHMWWNDTECNAAVGMKAFFDMMHDGPHKVMLFGAACTHVTDPIAKASKHWHLTQLSYADTHPMFTPVHFPNFFRVVPSENAFNHPRLKMMQHFNWTRVGTIYQNEPRYSLAHNKLVADLDLMGFEVVETQSFATDVTSAINKLKEKDLRIVLGNFNESWARAVFCQAHKVGMTGRKYQWLIMGTYGGKWWMEPAPCQQEVLLQAIEGAILTDLLPLATTGEITISGITADEYKEEYDSRRGGEYSRFHGYTYDGVWAVALAIQHVAHRLRHYRKEQTVTDFKYRDPIWEKLFLEALRNTSFEGVTGPVRFYDNERNANILLKQIQNGSEVKIAEYNGVTGELDLSRGLGIRWLEGRGPPKDRTHTLIEHSHVNVAVYSVLAAASCLGIILASVFLVINFKYRNQRYIKMSSPHLNNLIIIGSILTYLSVIFLGLDSRLTSVQVFPYVCTARAWLLMAGFSLAFGAMFSKTWRVHSIFTDVKLNKKVIKDYQLFMVVGVLLAIDLIIMTTWQVTDPFFRDTKLMEPFPHPHSEDIIIYPENEYCISNQMNIFVGIIYAYKGLLMLFGAFLAWETRSVSIPALNDSKYVGMSVYNVVLICVMGAGISFVLSDQQNASFILISVFIIFCATITLCLVFVPKVVELRRNPQGVIDKRVRATLRPMSSRRDSGQLEEKMKEAKGDNQRWRKVLMEREAELQSLLARLGEGDKIPASQPLPVPVVNAQPIQVIPQAQPQPPLSKLDTSPHITVKKEAPSATETTEVTSICSLNSSHEDELYSAINNHSTELPPRKKSIYSPVPSPVDDTRDDLENVTVIEEPPKKILHSPASQGSVKVVSWDECGGGSGRLRRRSSAAPRSVQTPPPERRTSIPGRRTPTFVHQDELWLTQRHHRTRCSNPSTNQAEDDSAIMQRSVSERAKCCPHETMTIGRNTGPGHCATLPHCGTLPGHCTVPRPLKKPTPAHVQSTPNVHASLTEGELLDLSILPIFQKLLTERKGAAIASCPNIAIKCDIVEYL